MKVTRVVFTPDEYGRWYQSLVGSFLPLAPDERVSKDNRYERTTEEVEIPDPVPQWIHDIAHSWCVASGDVADLEKRIAAAYRAAKERGEA